MGNPGSVGIKCLVLRIFQNFKIKKSFRYLHTNEDTVAAAIKAGCNLELGTNVYNSSLNAMKQGKLTEHEIRENVKVNMSSNSDQFFFCTVINYSIGTPCFKVCFKFMRMIISKYTCIYNTFIYYHTE